MAGEQADSSTSSTGWLSLSSRSAGLAQLPPDATMLFQHAQPTTADNNESVSTRAAIWRRWSNYRSRFDTGDARTNCQPTDIDWFRLLRCAKSTIMHCSLSPVPLS
jgi:hypothetical protein